MHGALRAAAKSFVLKPLEQSTPLISWTKVIANGKSIFRYEGTLTTSSNNILKISYKPESKLLIIEGYNFGFMIDENYPNLTRAIDDAIKGTPPDTIE